MNALGAFVAGSNPATLTKSGDLMLCLSCGNEFKPIAKGSGGKNRTFCYDCMPDGLDKSARKRMRQQLLVEKARKLKSDTGCAVCGYNKCPEALEYHHTDDNKENHPSELLKKNWPDYEKEIAKCTLLCSNCHREVHAGLTKITTSL